MRYVFLISGKKRAGKDTLANAIRLRQHSWSCDIAHFASTLKLACSELLPNHSSSVFNGERKEELRPLLQKVGDAAREFDEDIFVRALEARCAHTGVLIVPDVRYPNELKLYADDPKVKVYKVRIERRGGPEADNHQSETALDDYTGWDYKRCFDSGDIAGIEAFANELVELLPKTVGKTVYLAGGMQYSDDYGVSWRKAATEKLDKVGIAAWNPFEQDTSDLAPDELQRVIAGHTDPDTLAIMRKIIERDNDRVYDTDAVLCLWDESARLGGGTHGEINYAYQEGKPVYLVAKTELPLWTHACCHKIFDTVDDAIKALEEDLGR